MQPVWITEGAARPFYARTRAKMRGKAVSAVAEVCGLGQFNFYINGQKVGDHVLDPGWTDYNKLVQFVTFDVTSLLREGENVLVAEVGNGWYHLDEEGYVFHFPKFAPPNPNPYRPFGPCLVLAVEVKITYADGSVQRICTGEEWKVAAHPVVASNVYGSETIDHRLSQPGWNAGGFDDGAWASAQLVSPENAPKGRLIPQIQPAIRALRTYAGRYLHTVNGRKIYDLGQNLSGMLHIRLKGRAGEAIRVYPAEKLDAAGDADQMAKNWLEIDSRMTCIPAKDGEWEDFDSVFAYVAGRYLAVEGNAEVAEVSAQAISSAGKDDGEFWCDDDRYLKIYQMIQRAVEANLLSVHTDCPTIERFAWQEPNHLMAPSIFYMKDGRKLWEKFLMDMRAAQHTGKEAFHDGKGGLFYPGAGLVPSQAPCYMPSVLPNPGMGSFYDTIAWGSASILAAWWHYWFYGDEGILRDNYEMGLRYLEYLKTRVTPEGFINHGLGDWGNPERQYARENVETAFLYADAATLARMAKILQKPRDEEALLSYAAAVRDNYNQKLMQINPATGLWCYRSWESGDEFRTTQACLALPLYWGMAPEEQKAQLEESFRRALREKGAFVSGEIGLPYIIQTARQLGMNREIAEFITREQHPSYYAFVLDGETTLGEYWEQNPRSHCHDMMGHVIEWYYNGVAGIQPQTAGFGEVLVQPYLPERMRRVDCSYRSANGKIRVEMEETEAEIRVRITAPEKMQVRFDSQNLENRNKKITLELLRKKGN